MQEDLEGALLVFIIMSIGIVAAAILYLRKWLESTEIKSNTLKAIFCLEFEEEAKLQIARSPTEEFETRRKKTLRGRLENIAEELTSPFRSTVTPTSTMVSPDLESGVGNWGYSPNFNKTVNLGHLQRHHRVQPVNGTPISSPELPERHRRFST